MLEFSFVAGGAVSSLLEASIGAASGLKVSSGADSFLKVALTAVSLVFVEAVSSSKVALSAASLVASKAASFLKFAVAAATSSKETKKLLTDVGLRLGWKNLKFVSLR